MGEEAAEESGSITMTLPEAMTMANVAPKVVKVKGPPVLPWMRSPVEIGVHEPQSVNEVPLLDPRFVFFTLLLIERCFVKCSIVFFLSHRAHRAMIDNV